MNAPFFSADVSASQRRLLVVSPHFPPTDVVDMHRVRMNVRHYEAHGWKPTVLSVRPESTGRLIDRNLTNTIPDDIARVEAGAIPLWLTGPLGITALGLRAFISLRAAGDELLRQHKFDLALISTTVFPIMMLGAYWRRKFGLPYVLDMQDPWYTAPDSARPFARMGVKHRIMRRLHRSLEQRALARASGLISVSPDYVDALRSAYPNLRNAPCEVIPFGFAETDLEAAERFGRPLRLAPESTGSPSCLFAGRGGVGMERALKTLFAMIRRSGNLETNLFSRLHYVFLGTGYKRRGNPKVIEQLAKQSQVADFVHEIPDRIPLLDALRTLGEADVLLLLGSDDLSYQPSKLYQYLHVNKPILCITPLRSRLMLDLSDIDSVVLIPSDGPLTDETVRKAALRLQRLLSPQDGQSRNHLTGKRLISAKSYESGTLAARECALFDRVLATGCA